MRALIPSWFTSFSLSDFSFGSKLKELTTKFEKIVKDKNDLGLIEKSNVKFEERLESTPLYDESRVYGRDAEKERIIQLLSGSETRVAGCTLLVTTRNKSVVSKIRATSEYPLEQLSLYESVSLLASYAFGNETKLDEFPDLKDMGDGEAYNKDENIRHLSFVSSRYDTLKRFKNISELKQLRTFLALYRGINKERSELPNNIGHLKLLRHLDLSWSHITRLPDSVTTLYNIQTLILYQCSYLVELPKEIKNLIELHKLDLDYTKNLREMPSGISSLTKLQTLSKFIVSMGDKHQIRELQELTRLRGKLSIYGLDNVQDIKDVRCANLKGKEGLDDITLIWSSEFYDSRNLELEMMVLNSLEPTKNLKVLQIESYGGNYFPSWLGKPYFANMVRIALLGCKKCKSLPSLGSLPLLKYLRIEGMDRVERVGPEFYGSKSFPNLETLEFENMAHEKMCGAFVLIVEKSGVLTIESYSSVVQLPRAFRTKIT
ncbi:hypothetical protein ACFE04_010195 [Oxalis oulophora]